MSSKLQTDGACLHHGSSAPPRHCGPGEAGAECLMRVCRAWRVPERGGASELAAPRRGGGMHWRPSSESRARLVVPLCRCLSRLACQISPGLRCQRGDCSAHLLPRSALRRRQEPQPVGSLRDIRAKKTTLVASTLLTGACFLGVEPGSIESLPPTQPATIRPALQLGDFCCPHSRNASRSSRFTRGAPRPSPVAAKGLARKIDRANELNPIAARRFGLASPKKRQVRRRGTSTAL